MRHTSSATETSGPERARGNPLHRKELLLSGHDVGKIYLFEAEQSVKLLKALTAANANDVVFALNFGNKDSRLCLEGLKLLSRKTEVNTPCVNAVFFELKSLAASLGIGDGFRLDGHFDSSVNTLLPNLNSVNAVALLKLLNTSTLFAELFEV